MPARKKSAKKKKAAKKKGIASKKTTGAKASSSRTERKSTKSSVDKTGPEFLIFNIPKTLKEGSTLRLVHVSRSLNEAKLVIDKIISNKISFYAILEKKSVFMRAPVTTTTVVERNVVTD